ncbi:MAG: class I tRNA ligase family protein [Nanoarchaeota archaeon]|nr:class I tRNA ligase family protein [Nanoarchaeota archaeon]
MVYDFQTVEKEILAYWEKSKIFDKLRKKNKGKKKWSFLDGPITANNAMGVHHAWGRTYKDLFQRFKAMQGHELRYQNGFDCQGLWVEREEEKDLGLKDKKAIEEYGILNFVKACRKRVEKFSKIQTEQSIKLGMWMDWDNSYYTMSDGNQLHNWMLLKKYFDNGWLYKGKDAVPWCGRCGTASSKHDIVTEGYIDVTHKALFMQFPLKNNPDEYFLIFTTTPWTVPANVAIAVNEKIDYVLVDNEGVKYWLAEKRVSELQGNSKILKKVKGKKLEEMEYVMPYASFESQKDSPHKVVLWDLASEEEGTGIVHIAPGCGSEDFQLGKKLGMPAISPLDDAGIYKEGYEEFSLKKYSAVNDMVLEDLEQRRFVYKIEPYKHRYPHCWRCGEELVFRLVDEWYIKGDEMREKLIKENKKIKWYPEYGKIRQEDWFNNMGDWLISRKRYWGLPLPIWECECGEIHVFGSLEELKKKAVDAKLVDKLPEIHRPWVDDILIKCDKCGKDVKRIEDVGDAWLDAGIVSLSTIGPYLDNKKEWEKWFPADMISENMPGQFRGWFNALFWASTTLVGKAPFKSMFGYETLKDEKGNEMHKSKGNAIWFDDAVEKIGADVMRLMYALQDPSQELRFGYNVAREPRNYLNVLFNLGRLIENGKGGKSSKIEDARKAKLSGATKSKTALLKNSEEFLGTSTLKRLQSSRRDGEDFAGKWIISKLNNLIKKSSDEMDEMHPHLYARAVLEFWLNDFSRGYIQFVRDRISDDDKNVKFVMKEVYVSLLKLCAPMIPFVVEKAWQDLKEKNIVSEESVHLCDWPKFDKKKIDEELEAEVEFVKQVIEKGLAVRDKEQIGLKWPLPKITVFSKVKKAVKRLEEIIKSQLNVKEVEIKSAKETELEIELDTKMTPELEAEGFARELSRKIQAERKNQGLVKEDVIELKIFVDEEMEKGIKSQEKFIKERTNSKKIDIFTDDKTEKFDKFEVKGKEFGVSVKKV